MTNSINVRKRNNDRHRDDVCKHNNFFPRIVLCNGGSEVVLKEPKTHMWVLFAFYYFILVIRSCLLVEKHG